jgi:hypothetical protein
MRVRRPGIQNRRKTHGEIRSLEQDGLGIPHPQQIARRRGNQTEQAGDKEDALRQDAAEVWAVTKIC